MRFFTLTSALALVAAAAAQTVGPNAFNLPTDGTQVFNAGQPSTLTWSNKQGSTVTITLRTGDRSNLQDVAVIAQSVPNTGSYTWNVSPSLAEGANYALQIVDDQDPSQINYSGQFVIQSSVKAVATSGGSTSVVTATSASLVTSMPTGVTVTSAPSASASAATNGTSSGMSMSASKSASGPKSSSASSTSSPSSAAVPTNAGSRPVAGAAGALLIVAAGFIFAL